MDTIPGFRVRGILHEGARTTIVRAVRDADQLPVVLKVLGKDPSRREEEARFRHEFEIARRVCFDGIARTYSMEEHGNRLAMVIEDFGGQSLDRVIQEEGALGVETFLSIAIRLANVLGEVHHRGVIHKDINPSNVLWNRDTTELKLIDFGSSSLLASENPTNPSVDGMEGTLAYVSPEQTGRMNRPIDFRTDYYSLGVSFYELLTGRPPFASTDPIELVHSHLAREARTPRELDPRIPGMVSGIVMKLLAKMAEDRYQSAFGLAADLERCRREVLRDGGAADFGLGEQDVPQEFLISHRLYGRETEVAQLMRLFDEVSAGSREILLVAGYAGVGKSALVHEIRRPIAARKGYFIAGKFDLLKRNVPYQSIIQAFQDLVRQILRESRASIGIWRETLQGAVGSNGQVLVDVIPEVRLVIGDQSDVPALPPTESQNRFHLVFQSFARAVANAEHPLVLFMDDLQWADLPSMKLIEQLMGDGRMGHLMIIGAYRDNEVTGSHPLLSMMDGMREGGIAIRHLALAPLSIEHVRRLVADTARRTETEAEELAEWCVERTRGNPFFLRQFLRSLHEQGLMVLDEAAGVWRWEMAQIRRARITDDVAQLMSDRLRKLTPRAEEALRVAACIGARFDLATLSAVRQETLRNTAEALWEALQQGLVAPLDEAYKYVGDGGNASYEFVHDRIQHAAYALMDDLQKKGAHLRIGKLMLRNANESDREEKIFDIVDQLNSGRELLDSEGEKCELAALNLDAGRRAKASAAFEPFYSYLRTALELLEADSWERHYRLALDVHTEAAEAAYLCGAMDEMVRLSDLVIHSSRSALDRVKVYETAVTAAIVNHDLAKGIKDGLSIVRQLGLGFPGSAGSLVVAWELLVTKLRLIGREIEDLAELPAMQNPSWTAAMRILSMIGVASKYSEPRLLALITLRIVRLLLRAGNSYLAPFAYVGYGLILCSVLNDVVTGSRFGKLALRVLERFPAKDQVPRTTVVYHYMIAHWQAPVRSSTAPLWEMHRQAVDIGDFVWGEIALHASVRYAYFAGENLRELIERRFPQADTPLAKKATWGIRQEIRNLCSAMERPLVLEGDGYTEEQMLRTFADAHNHTQLAMIYRSKLTLCVLFGAYGEALAAADSATEHLDGISGTAEIPVYYFYSSLACIGALPGIPERRARKSLTRRCAANQKRMAKWARLAPANYLSKYCLVEAERHRMAGKPSEAIQFYDKAIDLARANELLNEEALANELAGRFFLSRGQERVAGAYMREAHSCYERWGAEGKAAQVARAHAAVFATRPGDTDPNGTSAASARSGPAGMLDLVSLLKASQAISREIVLRQLLDRLMNIAIENVGAQRGYLILQREGGWYVEAEGALSPRDKVVSLPLRIDGPESEHATAVVPRAVVHFVMRTGESVVLQDAATDAEYGGDEYVREFRPKSVLCFPLVNQGRLVGVLYLENNLTAGAFTPERLQVLHLLGSQIAISLENAQNYQKVQDLNRNLELRVGERTQELHTRNRQLHESIQYALTIQRSVLPREDRMAEVCPRHFVIWKPRDVVGGDFYYFGRYGDDFLLGVADCTGHGVPGAFMTMMVKSVLDRIAGDVCHDDPAKILKELNRMIRTTLNQSEEGALSDDGLDIGLCYVRTKQKVLVYAGAKVRLYYCAGGEVFEVRGDRQSIGYRQSAEGYDYTNREIRIRKDSVFYLMTDGYLHQSGGERGFSFGRQPLRRLWAQVYQKPMAEQREAMERRLGDYQGSEAQRDDITVIGFAAGREEANQSDDD